MKTFLEVAADAIAKRLNDREVEFRTGEAELAAHGASSRVVWVWRGGRLAPATRGGPAQVDRSVVVRPLHDKLAVVQAYLRAPSDAALEDLWARLLSAVRATLGTASIAGDYALEPRDSVSRRVDSSALMQSFQWRLSIREQQPRGQPAPTVLFAFDTSYELLPPPGES